MISPVNDLAALAARLNPRKINPDELNRDQQTPKFDTATALARAERKAPRISAHRDEQMTVVAHHDGPLHVHMEQARVAGPHHLAVYIEGDYCPDHETASGSHGHNHAAHGHAAHASQSKCDPDCVREHFSRLLTTLVPVTGSTRRTGDSKPQRSRKNAPRTRKRAGKPKHRP
jgi:hypothetical protein